MEITYGHRVHSNDDEYFRMAEQFIHLLRDAGRPSLLDLVPARQWSFSTYKQRACTDSASRWQSISYRRGSQEHGLSSIYKVMRPSRLSTRYLRKLIANRWLTMLCRYQTIPASHDRPPRLRCPERDGASTDTFLR